MSRSNSQWQGSCVHDVQVPKWVQKRKQVHPDEETGIVDYEQPRRAAKVVVNMKFSLIAVGTQRSVSIFFSSHIVTYVMTLTPLVAMSSTQAFPRTAVWHPNLKYWKPLNFTISKIEDRYVPWNGVRMDTFSLLVGKKGGLFGAWLDGVWHGALGGRTRPTRTGTKNNIGPRQQY